jgi:outer membrane autotransporter protein
MKNNNLMHGTRLIVTNAIASAMLLVYGRSAYAGTCVETPVASGNWICSGAAGADVTQPIIGGPVTVTTTPGFGINTAAGNTLTINANGGISFIDTNASVINAANHGISARNDASGDLIITSNGTVSGGNYGIFAYNGINTSDLTVTASNVASGLNGIDVFSYGTGAISVTSNGAVTSTYTSGIFARNTNNGTDMTITTGDVTGGQYGIRAFAYGTGANTVTATGTVTGTAIQGIAAQNNVAGTDLTVTAVDVTGGQFGIGAFNQGTGSTTVTSTGTVTGTTYTGIMAVNEGTTLTVNAVEVTGGQYGIFSRNFGSSNTVTATGTVTGTNALGIYATNGLYSTDLTVTAVDVIGGQTGISVINYGIGATSVTSTGTVTGTNVEGIFARNWNTSTDITISAVDVSGGSTGIYATNNGSGATNITSTGTVTGTSNNGIFARNNYTTSTDLIISAVDVSGGYNGIVGLNYGSGETIIISTGNVTGSIYGIYARNGSYTTGLTITATDLTGGIDTINYGGATTISTNGTVIAVGTGIRAQNRGFNSTDLSINLLDVVGGQIGLLAFNAGDGETNITATGTITGTNGTGIYVGNTLTSTNLSISAIDVIGGLDGIAARNSGTGETTITSTGTVTGTNYIGIYARNSGASSDLTINSVDVNGGEFGIGALNFGSGATTVNSTGMVIGTIGAGISVTHGGFNSDATVNAVDVVGGHTGIFGFNIGYNSSLNITTTGTVTATAPNSYSGIYARNGTYANDITVNAVDVTGGVAGIGVRNFGNGSSTITTTGTVTGTRRNGIYADNGASSAGLTITANDVFGHQSGIYARNFGRGSTVITSTGTVTGDYQHGIYALNVGFGTSQDITITTVDVSGNFDGILAVNSSGGTTAITSNGTVTGQNGIVGSGFNVMTINAANVIASNTGITTYSGGSLGSTSISVTGNILGGTGAGINASTDSGSVTTINLASTSTVTAISGNAIVNNFGDSSINVAAGAIINGSVRLNDGSDTVNIAGGTNLAGITALDGGDDVLLGDGFVDILNLNAAWTGNLNGANILNWEFININGGTVGFSNAAITAGQINVNNFGSLNGSNNLNITGNTAVASGSRIIAGNAVGTNAMNISGNLFNAGSVQLSGPLGQQAVGDRLTVAGNYLGSSGTLVLDTVLNSDTSATDRLVVAGNTSGSTGIFVNNVGGLGAMTTGDGIMLVDVAGASAANAFSLNNSVMAGAFNYRLYQNGISSPADGDWYLRSSARGITSPAIVLSAMANKVGLSMLGTLQERFSMSNVEDDGGAWVRIVGNAGSQTHESSIGNFEGRNDSSFVQSGVDLHRTENTRWGTFVAKTVSTTHMFDPSIAPDVEVGKASLDGYALGGYATYFTDTYYWDAVIQQSWLDATITGEADSFKTDNKNWLASFEFGRSFELGNNAIEPQAQIIAGNGSIDDVTDGVTTYNYSDQNVLVGRLGIRWTHAKDEGNFKRRFVPFLKANVSRDFGDDSFVKIGVSDITTERNDTWAEVGLGFSLLTQYNWSVFMQYDYEKGIGQSDRENHSGTIGLRRNW